MRRETRRLAAILAAEVADYSRLIGRDEESTLRALRAHRRELIGPVIDEHGGRIANTAGDSLVLEFSSAVDAVRCAIAIQRGMAERNEDTERSRRIQYRIGINVGDIVAEADDLMGDDVNIAARLARLAEPGGICLSAAAHAYAAGKVESDFVDCGDHDLKNITRPIHVWRWQGAPVADAAGMAGPTARLALPDKPSIAVLPFENMSGDPAQEYLGDGIAEDIITALSRFRWLFVIARNSSFTFKAKSVSAREVAEQLGVRYVLEGSVRRSASRVRIRAELSDAASDSQIWSERYDREFADIFDLQDDIAETLIGAIAPELEGAEQIRARRKPPENLDAWERYQRGLWHHWRFTLDDAEEAVRQFEGAISLASDFAPAYAGLAYVLHNYVIHGWTDSPDRELRRGLQAAQHAVSLDDKDAFAHCVLGRIYTDLGEIELAIPELEIALDLNPNLALAHYGLGFALVWAGRAQEALSCFRKVIRQSPRDPNEWTFEMMTGHAHWQLGENAEAVYWQKRAARHANSGFWPHLHLAVALVELERLDEARAAIAAAVQARADLSVASVSAMIREMHADYRDRFFAALRTAGLPA